MRYGYDRIVWAPEGAGAGGTGGGVGEAAPGAGGGASVAGAAEVNGGAGTGAAGANNPGPGGGGGSWFDKLTPEDKTWAESKGWKADTDPAAIADSYKNLEKLFGADKAGRTVLLPKDATDTAATDAIFSKLGKPAAADGYAIELPEGADPTFANTMKGVFHKANLTVDQAKTVTEAYRAAELDAATEADRRLKQGEDSLRSEWGDKFDSHKETARAAWTAAKVPVEMIERMTAVDPVLVGKMMEFFGRNYVEASPPGQEGRSAPGFGSVTPAAAQQKIDQLRADANFMARYGHSDPKIREPAMAEMNALTQVAVNTKRA